MSELKNAKSIQTYMIPMPKIIEIPNFWLVDMRNDQMTFCGSIRIATSEIRLTMVPER